MEISPLSSSLLMTAATLISERIIIEAKRELYLTNKTVKEIAYGLGYDDEYYFSRFSRLILIFLRKCTATKLDSDVERPESADRRPNSPRRIFPVIPGEIDNDLIVV